MTELPRLFKSRRRRIDYWAWGLWGFWTLIIVLVPWVMEGGPRHLFDDFLVGALLTGLVVAWFLGPLWIVLRLLPPIRRIAGADLRRDLALTGIPASEVIWGQLDSRLISAVGPPLLPVAAGLMTAAMGLAVRMWTGRWEPMSSDMAVYWSGFGLLLGANVLLATAGAGWLLAAAASGAGLFGLAGRAVFVLGLAIGGILGLMNSQVIRYSHETFVFPLLAAACFLAAAAQLRFRDHPCKEACPEEADCGPAKPFLKRLALLMAITIVAGSGCRWILEIVSPAIKPDRSYSPPTDWMIQLVGGILPGLVLPAGLFYLSAAVLRKWLRPWTARLTWPYFLIGVLAVAGGTWMAEGRLNPFDDIDGQSEMISRWWNWMAPFLPAAGLALLAARRPVQLWGRGRRGLVAQMLLAVAAGSVLGWGIVKMREILPGTTRSLDWTSFGGLSFLVALLIAGSALLQRARRRATEHGDQPPRLAALAFGFAFLVTLDAFTWVPNVIVRGRDDVRVAACLALSAAGLAYVSWTRAVRGYYAKL